jgi:methylated-DNA-protein-cysteine methyltransferase-like protein
MNTPQQNRESIWQVVYQIPEGKVASYGQVAQQAGLPNASRLVGNTLKNLPTGTSLPWHRVVNSQGKISRPLNSPSYLEQKQRLVSEGIVFKKEKINRSHFAW